MTRLTGEIPHETRGTWGVVLPRCVAELRALRFMAARAVAASVKRRLAAAADPGVAAGQARYLKGAVECRGVRMPATREAVKAERAALAALTHAGRMDAARALLRSRYAEDKAAGVQIMRAWHKDITRAELAAIGPLIDENVTEWATADALASCVGGVVWRDETDACAAVVRAWKDAPCLWRQRVACVSFVTLARRSTRFHGVIEEICESCVDSDERFVQLGVGWVLREVGVLDLPRAVAFVRRRYHSMSREGLRYAIEKMRPPLRKAIMRAEWEEVERELEAS